MSDVNQNIREGVSDLRDSLLSSFYGIDERSYNFLYELVKLTLGQEEASAMDEKTEGTDGYYYYPVRTEEVYRSGVGDIAAMDDLLDALDNQLFMEDDEPEVDIYDDLA